MFVCFRSKEELAFADQGLIDASSQRWPPLSDEMFAVAEGTVEVPEY